MQPWPESDVEECLVLEGEIEIDGTVLRTGDMPLIASDTTHVPITGANGAIIYIRERWPYLD